VTQPEVLEIEVSVTIRQGGYPSLHLSESSRIYVRSFMECAKVLSTFHEVLMTLKARDETAR